MKKYFSLLIVSALCSTSFAQHKTPTEIPSSISWEFYAGNRAPVYTNSKKIKTHVNGFNGFASVRGISFDTEKAVSVGVFIGFTSESDMNSSSGVNNSGYYFNTEYGFSSLYGGISLFYKRVEVGVGYSSIDDNGHHIQLPRMYAKYGSYFLFSSDTKMKSYFGYCTPLIVKKLLYMKKKKGGTVPIDLRVGVHASRSGVGPIAQLSLRDKNLGFYATLRHPTFGFSFSF